MEVGPPGSPNRRRTQTAVVSPRLRAGVGSDYGKGPPSAGQVGNEETNRVEPLLTHRNVERRHRNQELWVFLGQRRAPRRVLSQGAACVLPWWCPVYRWRDLVAGADTEQENLSYRYRRPGHGHDRAVAARGRTPSGRNHEGQSTDARHRGGPARSSDEGLVMRLEPRGRAGQITLRPTREGRS